MMELEKFPSNLQINYLLEKTEEKIIHSEVSGHARQECFPFCILWGNCDQVIDNTLRSELTMRLGGKFSNEVLWIRDPSTLGEQFTEMFQTYRSNSEKGMVPLLNTFLLPILFMADQFDASGMRKCLQEIQEQMEQKGYKENYRIVYYCLLNYEKSGAGNHFKQELQKLFERKEYVHPLGIVTHDNMYQAPFQQYWKCLQVIAMHIFLQCTYSDEREFGDESQKSPRYFTLGYWKMDVMKQELNDCLIDAIEGQEQGEAQDRGVLEGIQKTIEEQAFFDVREWIEKFCHMPVLCSDQMEDLLHPKSFRKPRISCRELCRLWYGTEEAFSLFLKENIGDGSEAEKEERFWSSPIGTYGFVKENLEDVLIRLKGKWEEEGRLLSVEGQMDQSFQIDRKTELSDIKERLAEWIWETEARLFLCKRKCNLADKILQTLHTKEFQERLEAIGRRNREEVNQLKVLRREMARGQQSLLNHLRMPMNLKHTGVYGWSEDLLEERALKELQQDICQSVETMRMWLEKELTDILSAFLKEIETLKRNSKSELFYAAKLDIPETTEEREYLYLAQKYSGQDGLSSLERLLSQYLVNLRVCGREWQNPFCFELFCVKELKDLAEVYGID